MLWRSPTTHWHVVYTILHRNYKARANKLPGFILDCPGRYWNQGELTHYCTTRNQAVQAASAGSEIATEHDEEVAIIKAHADDTADLSATIARYGTDGEQLLAWAERNGMDPTHPGLQLLAALGESRAGCPFPNYLINSMDPPKAVTLMFQDAPDATPHRFTGADVPGPYRDGQIAC